MSSISADFTVGTHSGGPKEDIIVEWEGKLTGMRADTPVVMPRRYPSRLRSLRCDAFPPLTVTSLALQRYAECIAQFLAPGRASDKLRQQVAPASLTHQRRRAGSQHDSLPPSQNKGGGQRPGIGVDPLL